MTPSCCAHAVDAERLRIARELHDVVGHSITVMILQMAGAARLVDSDPQRARQAIDTAVSTGQEGLAEMRRLVHGLRAAAARPGSGLAQLPALAGRVRASGVQVGVWMRGEHGRVDPGVDAAAYRIVQEALTNIVRHAGPGTTAQVRLDWRPADLAVEILDDGAGQAEQALPVAVDDGHGLLGLAERVDLVGGRFESGPIGAAGFRVAAVLPRIP